jgi:hypothetical protein
MKPAHPQRRKVNGEVAPERTRSTLKKAIPTDATDETASSAAEASSLVDVFFGIATGLLVER